MDEDMEIEYIGESTASMGDAEEEVELTPQEYYEEALQDLKLIEVITQTKNIAGLYRKTAQKMKKAGDYRNAPRLVLRYRKKARQFRRKAKREIYDKACELMKTAQTVSEQRLVIDMFRRIPGFRDANELAAAFARQNRRAANRERIQNVLMSIAVLMAVASLLILIR